MAAPGWRRDAGIGGAVKPGQRIELSALTSLRGFAAWWVVAYHSRALFPDAAPAMRAVLAHGYLAVDFFFVLSGFVIALTYTERLSASRGSLADFARRRLARVYPLHLFMLVATLGYVLMLAARGNHVPGYYTVSGFLMSLVLVQSWGFGGPLAWNVPSWSISTELFAYILFPAIALYLRWRDRPLWLLLAAALVIAVAVWAVFAAAGARDLGYAIPRFGLFRCVAQFALGTIVHTLFQRARAGRAGPALAASLAVVAAMVAARLGGAPETATMPLLWAGLVIAVALAPAAWPLTARPLVYLGEISYATYLAHYLMFVLFKLLFVHGPLGEVPGWRAAGFYVAVLVASVLLYHLVERPAQRWLLGRRARAFRPA